MIIATVYMFMFLSLSYYNHEWIISAYRKVFVFILLSQLIYTW